MIGYRKALYTFKILCSASKLRPICNGIENYTNTLFATKKRDTNQETCHKKQTC